MNVIQSELVELDAMNTLCALKAPCLLSFCFLDFSIVLSRTCFELGGDVGILHILVLYLLFYLLFYIV